LVMDLLHGETLGSRLARDGRIPLGELATILSCVASAVAAAHAVGVVHRDLKPENVFLTAAPGGGVDVRVLDFGIAKLTSGLPAGRLTETGALLGTPFYMSLEQLLGERDIDARSDVWALGILLYECLTGRVPTFADNY